MPPVVGVFAAIRARLGDSLAPEPVGIQELDAFLDHAFPALLEATLPLAQGFSWEKAKKLAEAVSRAVKDGLPLVKGQDAKLVVEGVVSYLWTAFVVPVLPVYVRPFQGLLLTLLLGALEGIYRSRVKHS